MTSLEIYGLAAPFILGGAGWVLAIWARRHAERTHRAPASIARAAE
jgi:hypothetical protein